MQYRPDIDGLRALAVASVVLYHLGMGLSGGFVGVDVFFVVSGFLIAQILIREMSAGSFSYRSFWERRLRRLLPALAVMTLVTVFAGWVLLLPDHLSDLGGALVCQPLLLVNCYYWRVVKNGYFGDPPEIRPLLHTWSLGVEEQFYVFFPVFLGLLISRKSKNALVTGLICLFSISLALNLALTPVKSVFSFFMLPTRAWELALGALLSCKSEVIRLGSNARQALGLGGLLLLAYSILFFSDRTVFPGAAAIVPTVATAMLLLSGPSSLTGRLFSLRPLVWLGLISYSLYLWHWPCIAYAQYLGYLELPRQKVVCLLSTLVLGHLSWKWVETPIRTRRLCGSSRQIYLLAAAYLLSCCLLGGYFLGSRGARWRWPVVAPEPTRDFLQEVEPGSVKPVDLRKLGEQNAKPRFLLWGDSHGISLAPALDALARERGVAGLQLTRSATPPFSAGSDPSDWEKLAVQTIHETQVKQVYLVGRWRGYPETDFARVLPQTIEAIRRAGAEPIFILDVPEFSNDPTRAYLLQRRWSGIPGPAYDREKHRTFSGQLRSILDQVHCTTIDLEPAVERWSDWDQIPYYDRHHLSDAGAMRLKPVLAPSFR